MLGVGAVLPGTAGAAACVYDRSVVPSGALAATVDFWFARERDVLGCGERPSVGDDARGQIEVFDAFAEARASIEGVRGEAEEQACRVREAGAARVRPCGQKSWEVEPEGWLMRRVRITAV